MSHIYNLAERQKACHEQNDCSAYNELLLHEYQTYDYFTHASNQAAVQTSFIFIIIGLIFILTPWFTWLRKFQCNALASLAFILPVLVALIFGVFGGLLISFMSCFKQDCSVAASTAVFTLPILGLSLGIPLSAFAYRKRQQFRSALLKIKWPVWVALGAAIILFSTIRTHATITDNNKSNEAIKRSLRESKHY